MSTEDAAAELPSITVVTPCLNASETISETLASVRAQDYPSVEHVVVDGGSTDGTVELLAAAVGVRYVSEPDRGLSHAMNKGIAMATGDVLGWLNADDLYESGALAVVGRAFADHPEAEWATGLCRIVDREGREIRRAVTAYKSFFLRHYSFRLYLTQNFISAPATFIRKDAYGKDPYDERYRMSMDYDVQLRLARRSDPLIIDRPIAAFRMAEGSLGMSQFERQFAEHAENARTHGDGHAIAVTVNRLTSRGIVGIYHLLRVLRERRAHAR